MNTLKATQDKVLAVLQSVFDIVERRHTLAERAGVLERKMACSITNDFPEAGGGGACADAVDRASAGVTDAPEAASSDDDDGGDGDGEDDCRRPRSKKSPPPFAPALLAFAPLSHYVGFGRSRIYQLINAGEFPPPVKIGKSSRWVRAEIDNWLSAQIAARPTNQQVGG